MSVSLSAERDRIQQQVKELEQSLSAAHTEVELLSSETGDESDGNFTDEEAGQSAACLLAQREKIQMEIQNLENILGPHSPVCLSGDDSSSCEESELGLSLSVDSCLQINLVYQQVIQETLDQLETLLMQNHRQQKEVVSQLSGPIKESSSDQHTSSSCQQPNNMYLGRFLKPYFKDKLTGLGPPANQETKEKASRMTGCLDNKKLKLKRWESWQKTLLIHSVARDTLRRLIQPKLSRMDYLSQKLLSAEQTDRQQQLRQQMDSLEREIDLLKGKKEEELIGDRYEEHDWQKISNIDFEGTRDAEDIRSFWQNFLHPSINKSRWSQEEVQQLKEVSRRHGDRHWETIATELKTCRTAFLCLQTFQRFVSGSLRRGSWTPAEDALLRELVDKMRIGNFIPYTQMSYFMEGRDPAQLIYRWNQVLDPSLKKGPWTKQEDQLLLQAVSRYGEKNWWKIRMEVPGRSDSACRDRYLDCLKAGTKRGAFDSQEKELLLQLVEKHGVGRWAKIAAEIPHRFDAQCLREWRKLSRLPLFKKGNKSKKPSGNYGGEKMIFSAKKRIRRRLMRLKEQSSEEEEEVVVEYMDSDEEESKNKKEEVVEPERVEELEQEEKEEYTFPPMQEWTPAEKAQCFTFLSFRPVELPASGDAHDGKHVRSTILGRFGRSVIIGPHPRELSWEKRHSSSTMMMIQPDQLRAHLNHQAHKFKSSSSRGKVQTGKQNHKGRATDMSLSYELQAALTPWLGNLLIPAKNRLTAADALRERGETTQLSSTSIFLLLLQTMSVDTEGCKEVIEQRRNRVVLPTPHPDLSSAQMETPMTNARTLRQGEFKEELQHKLILKQLQVLQKQDKPNQQHWQLKQQVGAQYQQQSHQLVVLQPPPPQNLPGILPQMHPTVHPPMCHVSFPQAVFIPHPVTQRYAASIQLVPPSSLITPTLAPCRPSLSGLVTSQLLPPPSAPPVSMVPSPSNATSTHSSSSCPQARPLTGNLTAALPRPPDQHASVAATPSCPAPSPSSTIRNAPERGGLQAAEDQKAVCSSQNGVGGAGTGVGGAGGSVIEEGRRIRKVTQKARALREATEAKSEAKKKAASSPRQRIQIQTPPSLLTAPPAALQRPPPGVVSSQTPSLQHVLRLPAPPPLRLDGPLVSVNSALLPQIATPASSNSVSSTQNLTLAPPLSTPTNQLTAASVSSLPAPFLKDHDYTFLKVGPAARQHGSFSVQPKPPPKTLSREKKHPRVRESVTSSDQRVDKYTCDPGVIQAGKRVRKPSMRARALQETNMAKAEVKRKRTSPPSPHKKRSRSSRSSRSSPPPVEAAEKQPVTQIPELRLHPGQSVWVMTPGGLLQLAEAPPQGLQLALVPNVPLPPPPRNILNRQPAAPPLQLTTGSLRPVPFNLPGLNQPQPLPAHPNCPPKRPSFILQPVLDSPQPPCPLRPSPTPFLPHKGTVPPPHRREPLPLDPSLMFLESRPAVQEWLSGRGGVVIPGVSVALPYLPPFVSSLNTLSALLRAKRSLTKASLQLLCQGSKPRHPKPEPASSTERTSGQPADLPDLPDPPDLPDSTSDLRPAADKPAPSVSSDLLLQEEAELVVAVRQLVAERFSDNPAYQLLKARFLSCFTVPALLATVQPITGKTVASPANEDEEEKEEDEEEAELTKIIERGKQRRAKRSLLLCEGSGAPANHFSGIINTNTATNQP